MLLWTAIIAIATVLYTFFAAKLWSISRGTLQLTQKMFESTNRPFLFTEIPELALSNTTYPSMVKIKICNKGHIPSSEVTTSFRATFNTKDITKSATPSDPVSIFPNSFEEQAFQIQNSSNELFILTAYASRPNALDVFFNIKYHGIANQQYTTDCQYHYDSILKKFTTVRITWT